MKTFGEYDTVFARAISMGREIFNLPFYGVDSMDSVLSLLKQNQLIHGLVKITIRNLTQGWSHTYAYRVA